MTFGGSGITQELFVCLRGLLPDGKTVLELGSGDVSTPALAKFYTVYSVEHDPRFLHRHPATYIHAYIRNGWYDVETLQIRLPEDYDLILVDGPTGEGNRGGFLLHLDLFKHNVPILVDDTWRQPERELAVAVAEQLQRPCQFHEAFALIP
jgi:hypothetical protein